MKILNAEQLRLADKNIIRNQKISSVELMGRAANSCFQWLIDYLLTKLPERNINYAVTPIAYWDNGFHITPTDKKKKPHSFKNEVS